MLLYIFALLVIFLCIWWYKDESPNLPPGPKVLPIVGYLPFLGPKPHEKLFEIGEKYKGLFTIRLGMQKVLVINDWNAMKEALLTQSDIFSGRPPLFNFEVAVKKLDITTSDGSYWKAQRRFSLREMRNFGFGRTTAEDIILEQVRKVIVNLESSLDSKISSEDLFFIPVMNVVWSIIAGKQFGRVGDDNDEALQFIKISELMLEGMSNMGILNYLPIARFLPGSGFKNYLENNDKIMKYLADTVQYHIETYTGDFKRDFIDSYLEVVEMEKKRGLSDSNYQVKSLIAILWDLFTAGIETVNSTLLFAFLYMITWPKIEAKVQEELDTVVGRDRFPAYEDRKLHDTNLTVICTYVNNARKINISYRLPYTEAVLMEISRYSTVVPLSIPHCPTKTTKLLDYTIPKRMFCLQNIWAVHHDPKLWNDPDVFRPERFLDAEGKVFVPEYYIPFSLGGRVCLAETFAKMETFLFFTSLLQRFSFQNVTGEIPASFDVTIKLTLTPKPFNLVVEKR